MSSIIVAAANGLGPSLISTTSARSVGPSSTRMAIVAMVALEPGHHELLDL